MKVATSLLLPAVISAAAIQPRHEPGSPMPPPTAAAAAPAQTATVGGPAAPAKHDFTVQKPIELKSRFRSNAQRTKYRVGPLDLLPGLSGRNGMSLDSNGQGIMGTIKAGSFCGGADCTVLAGKAGLEYANGTEAIPATGVYIHHILATNNGKKVSPFVSQCDRPGDVKAVTAPPPQPAGFVGVSDDNGNEPIMYGTPDGKIEGGYFLGKGDSIGFWADLVNLEKERKQIYLTYDLEYLPGHMGADSQGSLISVTGCQMRRINAPATGPANTTSGNFKFFRDGYLVNGKGHLHDGGVAMDLTINDKYVCSSNALYGGPDHTRIENGKKWETISGMSICPGPIEIKAGDYMSLNSRYDLTMHPLRENGDKQMAEIMGMWTMNFIEKKGSQPKAA